MPHEALDSADPAGYIPGMSKPFRLTDLPYLRAFAGVSVGELARKLKVGVRDVERWEASEVIPQGAKMRRLRGWIASQLARMEDPEAWLREAKKNSAQGPASRVRKKD